MSLKSFIASLSQVQVSAPDPDPTPTGFWDTHLNTDRIVFVQLGQSNERRDFIPDSEKTLTSGTAYQFDGSSIVDLTSNLQVNTDTGDGAIFFAEKFEELTTYKAVMVQNAVDSSSMLSVTEGTAGNNWSSTGNLRGPAETKVNAAIALNDDKIPVFMITQGEQDSLGIRDAVITKSDYKTGFEDLLTWLRTNWPGMKLIIKELGKTNIGSFDSFLSGFTTPIREVHKEIASENSDCYLCSASAKFFVAEDRMADGLHWDYEGSQIVNIEVAENINRIANSEDVVLNEEIDPSTLSGYIDIDALNSSQFVLSGSVITTITEGYEDTIFNGNNSASLDETINGNTAIDLTGNKYIKVESSFSKSSSDLTIIAVVNQQTKTDSHWFINQLTNNFRFNNGGTDFIYVYNGDQSGSMTRSENDDVIALKLENGSPGQDAATVRNLDPAGSSNVFSGIALDNTLSIGARHDDDTQNADVKLGRLLIFGSALDNATLYRVQLYLYNMWLT